MEQSDTSHQLSDEQNDRKVFTRGCTQMKIISGLAILLTVIPNVALSECYEVSDIKGYMAYASSGGIEETTWYGSEFEITFDGKNSMLPTGDDSECEEVKKNTLMCIRQRTNGIAIEVWNVYPDSKTVVMTRQANGLGLRLDGAQVFSGKIVGSC
jgi:hypothetical protein